MNQPAKKASTAKRKPKRKKSIRSKSKTTNKSSKKNKSISEVVYESAKGLYDAGLIDATTMHEFDTLCLTPIKEMTPQQIKKVRLKEKVSQVVFAKYLNTSPSTIRQWENGAKHPRGISLKVLNLIDKNGLESFT